ncbi:MAG TPA: SGNH/GDSL hydrolase family protein [Catalimonadaceae bacterium]|nr:SGNH/GDSL hydrolase family protein [Catalimonadaceae bacterium]
MNTFTYLALGDSYTIGESVPADQNFPAQLSQKLEKTSNLSCKKLKIIAKTGWTTDELQKGIQRAKPGSDFDLVTLLIGVNNQYRSYGQDQYKKEFSELLRQAISFASGNQSKVIVVTIPDYGCTPFGAEMADKIYTDLVWYNETATKIARNSGVEVVDIFAISRKAKTEPVLIASDNLHPSAEMYTLWADAILPVAERILADGIPAE